MAVVFITGASSGIGYATALAFARQGAQVIGTARRQERLQGLAEQIAPLPGAFLPVVADVRSESDMQAAVHQTVEHFGKIDVLVVNAGVGQRGSLVESEWDDLEILLRTNIDGALHSIRAAVPHMPDGGQVIMVSSVTYNMMSPYAASYAASKAFVSSIAGSLRLELASRRIQVTEMLVGRTQSEFSEKRLGMTGYSRSASKLPVMTAEQVADAVVRATRTRRSRMTLRWFDRLLLLGNVLIPGIIGRLAMRQYR